MSKLNYFYEEIRNKVYVSSIVKRKVTLTKKGVEYLGICPFHSEKTPSFTVNDKKKFFHCFGCSAHGDVIKFTSELSGLTYREAAITLANESGIPLPRFSAESEQAYQEIEIIHSVLKLAQEFFTRHLAKQTLNYLYDRDLSDSQIQEYRIGYAPGKNLLLNFLESKKISLSLIQKAGLINKTSNGRIYEIFKNRIIFPILNSDSKVIGFAGRVIDESQPKYLNSPETILFKKNEVLYGENIAISAAYTKNRIIVVEGYLDAIAMHSAGFAETVATMGTALTESHLDKLWKISDEIILCFDGDEAGIRAYSKIVNMVLSRVNCTSSVSFMVLPNKMDPDQVIKKHGKEYLSNLLHRRYSLGEGIWYLETRGTEFSTPETRAALDKRIENYLSKVNDRILRRSYYQYFKEKQWNLQRSKLTLNSKQKNFSNLKERLKVNLEIREYDKEYLERLLLLIVLIFPELKNNEPLFDVFLNMNFINSDDQALKEWIVDYLSNTDSNINRNLLEEIKKTRFSKMFVVLSDSPVFLRLISSKATQSHQPDLLWDFFYKKYQILILKEEYFELLKKDQAMCKKAELYQQEILRVEYEMNALSQTLNFEKGHYAHSE